MVTQFTLKYLKSFRLHFTVMRFFEFIKGLENDLLDNTIAFEYVSYTVKKLQFKCIIQLFYTLPNCLINLRQNSAVAFISMQEGSFLL